MKPVDVKSSTYIDFDKENNKVDPKLEVGDHLRILIDKNIFAKGYVQNWPEEVFVIKKFKNAVMWTYAVSDLNSKEIVGMFYKKKLQKTGQTEFRIEKVIKRNYMSDGKIMIIHLIVRLIKKILLYKMSYFPQLYTRIKNKIKVELDLPHYATKSHLKNSTGVDTPNFLKRLI